MAKPTSLGLNEAAIAPDREKALLKLIIDKCWWQGSVISYRDLAEYIPQENHFDFWVITSQTCNLYNPSFENVPYFELAPAKLILECHKGKTQGDHPRILHVDAQVDNEQPIHLELQIQNRRWLPREVLAKLTAPTLNIRDGQNEQDTKWLDNFAGWLGRSYTRVTLPDKFNDAIQISKITDVFEEKLRKHKDSLYGIYLKLDQDVDDPWQGSYGEMPPPYILGVMLITEKNADPDEFKKILIAHLFENEVSEPDDKNAKITRSELAKRNQIRMMRSDILVRTVEQATLIEIRGYVRYTFVDHLSNSEMAVT